MKVTDSGTQGDGDSTDDDSSAGGVGPGGIPDGGTVIPMPNGEEHVYDADGNLVGALTEDGNLYWPEDWGHHGPPDSETSCLPYWMTQGHGVQPDTMNIVATFLGATKGGGWIFRIGKYLTGKSSQGVGSNEGLSVAARMYRNAIQPFKGGFTKAGRALTKHPNIVGAKSAQELIKRFGNNAGINKAAADALKNIMRNGTRTTKSHTDFGRVVDFKLPNGLGARFNEITNGFIGFLGRGR